MKNKVKKFKILMKLCQKTNAWNRKSKEQLRRTVLCFLTDFINF